MILAFLLMALKKPFYRMQNFPLLCGAIMIIGSCIQRPKANEPAPAGFLPENIKTADRLVGIFNL